ncbi:hypothetical protein [Cryobacterium sp. TMT4-10]|uniref:hypothetical protein n=1 Tax=Cryobacterium sp. TMT4-10 TaxID=1259256 RepID=UPI00106DC79C|nr:hypothetical protein [Cryobacterium sp. TMT4-10]TFD12143.1 hypothetical protein E3T42_15285 [Cryobacterium sp. TMT4-10]
MLVSAFQWLPERRLGMAATLAHADELIEQVGELLFGYLAQEGGVVSIKEVPKGPVPVQLYRDGVLTSFDDIPVGWETSFIRSGRDFVEALIEGRDPQLSGESAKELLAFDLSAQISAAIGSEQVLCGNQIPATAPDPSREASRTIDCRMSALLEM